MESGVDWVILVDDDEIHNFIHLKILKKYVTEDKIMLADNGEQAILLLDLKIQNCENHKNGLVFLDINMPIMNGFQFIELFNKEYADIFTHTRILPLSSSEHMQDLFQMNDLGVEGYLVKPLTYEMAEEVFELYKKEIE